MLNSVRNSGFGDREFSVVWLQPLAAPTIIVACGPRRISAAMSTTYDTDMLEPLAIGNWTLNADVSDDSRTRNSERGDRGEGRARHEHAEGQRAERDDREDVPAAAGREIPKQGAVSISCLTVFKHLFYTFV